MTNARTALHVPEPGNDWQRRNPAELGLDPDGVAEAVAFIQDHETDVDRDIPAVLQQLPVNDHHNNDIVGPTKARGGVNGVIVRDGQIAAEWGEVQRVDMTFSVAKSYLSTVAGLAYDKGLMPADLDQPICATVDDPVFESDHNQMITWRMLLQQTSEWEGDLWEKPDTADRRKGRDREIETPGTFWEYNDVRVNLMAYTLLKLFREPLPTVLRREVMSQIGATNTWEWYGYSTSWTQIDGYRVQSVSGGGHWGGGVWASSLDHARIGQLFTAGGRWGDKQLVSQEWIDLMTAPCPLNESYGFMWWVNQNQELFPSAPSTSYFAIGMGTNIIWIDPDLGLTAVLRWVQRDAVDGFCQRVVSALK